MIYLHPDTREAYKLLHDGGLALTRCEQQGLRVDIKYIHKQQKVLKEKTPVLGICLGMQLLTNKSEEGKLPGLGWIEAETKKFDFSVINKKLRIPHMGWNRISPKNKELLFANLNNPRFYFVHSYHVICKNSSFAIATTTYGYDFTCAIRKGNIIGTQFHPEKSHKYGMTLLQNFAGVSTNA